MKRSEGYILVRYNSRSGGTQTFKGAKTNTAYRFSTNAHNRIKWVFEDDIPHLLELMDGGLHQFEVVDDRGVRGNGSPSPEMVAPGAPSREEVAPVAQATPEISPAIAVMPGGSIAGAQPDGQKLTRLPENPEQAEAVAQAHVDQTLNSQPEPEVPHFLDRSIADLKEGVDEFAIEEIGVLIAKEKAGKNRAGAIKVLTDAMMEKVNA